MRTLVSTGADADRPADTACSPARARAACGRQERSPQAPGADFPGAPRERPLGSLLRSDEAFVIGLADDETGYLIPRSEWDAKAP